MFAKCAALIVLLPVIVVSAKAETVVLTTRSLRLEISASGMVTGVVDKRTGKNFAAGGQSFVTIAAGGESRKPVSVQLQGDILRFRFTSPDNTVALKVLKHSDYLVFRLNYIEGAPVDEVTFCRIQTALIVRESDMAGVVSNGQYSCGLRVLDPTVGFQFAGGSSPLMSATWSSAQAKIWNAPGIVSGPGVALIGCPSNQMRFILKTVLTKEGVLHSQLGGPFALDANENRGSYVFAFGLSEANVNEWIQLCSKAGIKELHLISWESSLGHYQPNKTLFPHGVQGLKATVAKIHAAGLKAGMHTLTGLIGENDAYITPMPDGRLNVDARFTLASDLDASAAALTTNEPPQNLDTLWSYGSRGNVLRIDNELIMYAAYSGKPPYGFSECRRGAFGTKVAPHQKGARVDHLGVYAGCFLPDDNTALIDDIATNIAAICNNCKFDMIYMDGAEGTPGGWHGIYKMRAAIFSRLKGRVMVEASEWGYHSWPFHSRIGAWDYPNWGLKQFVDLHCKSNEEIRAASFMPAQLGWWSIFGPNDDRYAQLPDELEYLFCKALAFDMPMSFQGIGIGKPENERQDEYLEMMGKYERLRLAKRVPKSLLARLRTPGQDFHMIDTPNGPAFEPTDYLVHKATGMEDGNWTVDNRYKEQAVSLRIQALHSAAPFNDAEGVLLFNGTGKLPPVECSAGASGSLGLSDDKSPDGGQSIEYLAKAANGANAWTRATVAFAAPRDLTKCAAFGVWVKGDGKGEILNFQLTNPIQYWPTCDEHYIKVDFTGWRYAEFYLRERDAAAWGNYSWPYGDSYSVYRNPLIRGAVSGLSIYFGAIPAGTEMRCVAGPIKALPVSSIKLINPVVAVNDTEVKFPVALESGQYIEYTSANDCRLYAATGKLLGPIKPEGVYQSLRAGSNTVTFKCDGPDGFRHRANVTIITHGDALKL